MTEPVPQSGHTSYMRRLFSFWGLLLVVVAPYEIVIFFSLIPGFGSDLGAQVPGPLGLKQAIAVLTPTIGFSLLLWGIRGIGDLELTDRGVVLPMASASGILRGVRTTIPFEDILGVRVIRRRYPGIAEIEFRRLHRNPGTRFVDLRFTPDADRFLDDLEKRVRVVRPDRT